MEPLRFPSNKISPRAKALSIIKERSFSFGTYKLSSGQVSNYYLDMKPTMFHPEGATLLAQLILERIDSLPVDYVGGLEMGAVPLIATISILSYDKGKPIPGFFVRKAIKDHGTKRRIEAADDIRGKNVVILEDVTTTGSSAMLAVEAARAAGGNILLVLSIVDREEGAAAFYEKVGIPFTWIFRTSDLMTA